MTLTKTKEILKRLQDRYGDSLRSAQLDIRPDYSGKGYGISSGVGYTYTGIDIPDRNFIYKSIGSLNASVNDLYGPIHFDIKHYVTETNAAEALDELGQFILKDLKKLKEINEKYKENTECANYPIQVCLRYHQEIYNILEEIFNSEEYLTFKNPEKIHTLEKENIDLKFDNYWLKRKWKYLIHLIAFSPFLIFAGWIFYHKYKHDLFGLSNTIVLITSGLLTIVFSLVFNNHRSFKDSWKLIFKKTRHRLKDKEKNDFKRQIRQ